MSKFQSTIRGIVEEALPNAEFRVRVGHERVLRCYLGGKLKMARIRILIGDTVYCIDAGNIGRIVRRGK